MGGKEGKTKGEGHWDNSGVGNWACEEQTKEVNIWSRDWKIKNAYVIFGECAFNIRLQVSAWICSFDRCRTFHYFNYEYARKTTRSLHPNKVRQRPSEYVISLNYQIGHFIDLLNLHNFDHTSIHIYVFNLKIFDMMLCWFDKYRYKFIYLWRTSQKHFREIAVCEL